jgi:hypothetical protein
MKMPQIRLKQTYAQIGLDTTKSKQEIRQPHAELNLRQEAAKLTIDRTPSRLEIDQTQAWNDQNLKDPFTLSRDWADEAKQLVLEGIARRAEEGTQLSRIEQGGNPIAAIARGNTSPPPADFNFGVMPQYGSVKIQFHPSMLNIQWELGGKTMDPVIHQPVHEYTPSKVEVYVKQKESLSIDFVGLSIDQYK